MKDLGHPTDAINLTGNIYSQFSTIFSRDHFGKTLPMPIQRRTIQGDTLSPYLLLIFKHIVVYVQNIFMRSTFKHTLMTFVGGEGQGIFANKDVMLMCGS